MSRRVSLPFVAPLLGRATREVVSQLGQPSLLLSRDDVVVYANQRFLHVIGLDGVIDGQSIFEIAGRAFDTTSIHELLEQVRQEGPIHGRRLDRFFDRVGRKVLCLDLVPIRGAFFDTGLTVITMQDETARVLLEGDVARRVANEVALATRLADLRILETPAATAAQIVDQMATMAGFDFQAIGLFGPTRQFVPLALKVPQGSPLAIGRPTPPARSAYLHERSHAGPWVETWRARPEDAAYGRQMIAAGLRAAAYAPIHGRDGLIGVLIMGTSSAAVAERIGDAFPAVISFGAIAGALLGRDDERRHLESKRRAEIESIIATGAFEPVFQPIVELASRRIVGYEALSRFADGRSPAARFADAAACGLGPALELACLRKALTQARSLARGAWLSVNASPALLVSEEADLAGLVGSTRRKLVLEITEQSAVDDYVALRLALAPFKPHIRVAVDDAGAGHAGLHRILELRADIVKLDRALIRGLDADPARQALVTGMAHFAKQTNAQLLGEGIETGAEALALRELGVPLGQGFLFGRPQRIQPDLVTSKAFPGRPHPAKIHQLRVSAQRIR